MRIMNWRMRRDETDSPQAPPTLECLSKPAVRRNENKRAGLGGGVITFPEFVNRRAGGLGADVEKYADCDTR